MYRLAKKVYVSSCVLLLVFTLLYLLLLTNTTTTDYRIPSKHDGSQHYYLKSRYQQTLLVPLCIDIKGDEGSSLETQRRYVLGLNYWEQTNMALGNMFALIAFAKHWSSRVVQPFIHNSRLYGLPHFLSDHHWSSTNTSMLTLDRIFDVTELNKLGATNKLPPLVNFCHFLRKARRDIILIHLISKRESREMPVLTSSDKLPLMKRLSTEHVFECSQYQSIQRIGHDIIKSLNYELFTAGASTEVSGTFRLSKHYCVNISIETTPTKLADQMLLSNDGDVSLLVRNWRGLGTNKVLTNSAKGLHKSKRLLIHNLTLYSHPRGSTHMFHHSSEVQKVTRYFMTSLGQNPGTYIAVHLRSEKLGQRDRRIYGFFDKCIKRLLSLARLYQHSHQNIPILYVSDYGPGGSDSCYACKGAKRLHKIFKNYNITPIHYDGQGLTVGQQDLYRHSGFIAAIEMELLIQSSTVVLVGGGTFERQLALHRKEGVVKICWDDEGSMQPQLIPEMDRW